MKKRGVRKMGAPDMNLGVVVAPCRKVKARSEMKSNRSSKSKVGCRPG